MIACLLLLAAPALGAPVDSAVHAWIGDLEPLAEAEFGYEQAAHLLERVGFGGTPAQIEELVSLGLEGAVTRLVDYEQVDDSDLPPSTSRGSGTGGWTRSRPAAPRRCGSGAGTEGRWASMCWPKGPRGRCSPWSTSSSTVCAATCWKRGGWRCGWGKRMVTTPRPLEEKMTLFWHDHFATSEVKVRDVRKMHLQNRTLRAHATGDFRSLVLAVMRDPAMLVYLDNRENVKDHPNENFGRELLELFTMGLNNLGNASNYTEQDIREASRAFTGWTNDVLDFRFDAELHDDGAKTFLGREGNLGGEEVLDIILEQPATAEFIAGKLFRYLVREDLAPRSRRNWVGACGNPDTS